jgi:hypothetical protein
VDALHGSLLLIGRQRMTGDLLSQNDGWGRLALDTGRKDFLSQRLCTGAGKSAEKPGERAFNDGAFSRSHSDGMRKGSK